MIKVALLQLLPCAAEEENRVKGMEYCRRAKALGADIALFPEMWSCGYGLRDDAEYVRSLAAEADGSFARSFAALAEELDMAIAVTLLERYEPAPRNTVLLFDRHGEKRLHYSKVHTCDFGEEKHLTPGESFRVTALDTAAGTVRVGAMICYDREFPESARLLMLGGAELILVPNACPMEINRISQLRARAYENMLGIATANYAEGMPDCNGHSTAFDGIAYRPDEPGSRDTLIIEADGNEGIYMAEFDIDAIRAYRAAEVHGNAYRRPKLYGALAEDTAAEPFLRGDRRCEIYRLREHPELAERAAEWFSSKWSVPKEAYLESIADCLKNEGAVPQWYLAMDRGTIAGGLGVIENDFHTRPDLTPNVCAVYVEEKYRCRGIAGRLLGFVCEDMRDFGTDTLYLLTDHDSFYERYGWEYLCPVYGEGEDEASRMYIHKT